MLPLERFCTLSTRAAVGARRALAGAVQRGAEASADHRLNELLAIEFARRRRHHPFAVAQHGDAVGQQQRFLERVADEDDADALFHQPPHQAEEVVLLLRRQRGGRLIENDDARLVMDGAGDLDHLLVRRAERGHQRGRIDLKVHAGEELLGLIVQAAQPVEELFVAQIDVLRHRHRRHQHGLLKHHGDAERQRFGRRRQHHRLAVEQHFAGRELVHAGQRLGQRRFAGAVLADDGVDLAGLQREIDVLDRGHAAKFFGGFAQFEDRAHDGFVPTGRSAAPDSRTSTPGPLAATSRSARSSHTDVMPWIMPSARL